MDDSTLGIVALLSISIVISCVVHFFIKSYLIASIISAIIATVTFQIVNRLYVGYLDPFFVIALFTGGLVAFGVSAVVGIPFMKFRKKFKANVVEKTQVQTVKNHNTNVAERLNLKDVLVCLDRKDYGDFTGIRIYHIERAEALNVLRNIHIKGTVIFGDIKESITYNDTYTINGNFLHSRKSRRINTKGVSGKDLFKKYSKNSFVPNPKVRYAFFKKRIIRDWKIVDHRVWTIGNRDETMFVSKVGVVVTEFNYD